MAPASGADIATALCEGGPRLRIAPVALTSELLPRQVSLLLLLLLLLLLVWWCYSKFPGPLYRDQSPCASSEQRRKQGRVAGDATGVASGSCLLRWDRQQQQGRVGTTGDVVLQVVAGWLLRRNALGAG